MFAQVRRIVEAAGESAGDIVKMTVWMRDRTKRAALNGPWVEMFPDPTRGRRGTRWTRRSTARSRWSATSSR